MSIASEIQRLQIAKSGIKQTLEENGATVGDNVKIGEYAQIIDDLLRRGGGGSGDYEQGFEDGKNSVVDYSRYAKTVQYIRRDLIDKKEITLNLDCVTNASHLLNNTNWSGNTIVEHITVNIPNKLALVNGMFHSQNPNDTVLKHITLNTDTSQATLAANMFRGCEALEIIDGTPLNFSSMTGTSINFLNLCTSLVDIRFVEKSIPISIGFASSAKLSAETIQSIIDGLADLTQYYEVGNQISTSEFEYPETEVKFEDVVSVESSGYTMSDGVPVYAVYVSDGSRYYAYKKVSDPQTLTLHANVGAKLTEAQKATITSKNWELVY